MNRRDLLKMGAALPLMPVLGKIELPKQLSDFPFLSTKCIDCYKIPIKVYVDNQEIDKCVYANSITNEYTITEGKEFIERTKLYSNKPSMPTNIINIEEAAEDVYLNTYIGKDVRLLVKPNIEYSFQLDELKLFQKNWYDTHINENIMYFSMTKGKSGRFENIENSRCVKCFCGRVYKGPPLC